MKRFLTIFILLCTIGTVHGAHFVYHAGGFRANYDVYAYNNPLFDGPWTLTQNSTNSVSVSRVSTGVPQARFYVLNDIRSDTSTNSIRIQSFSIAEGAADYSYCYARGKGFNRTQNAQGYGIFYKIMPDANEQNGDDVMVYYNHTANISTNNGTTSLRIGGSGTMDHIAITRGLLTPVATEPPREKEVLSFPDVNVTNGGSTDWFSGIHAFPALIGDVIGIFAENSTKVEGWGAMNGSIYSTFSMVLSVRTVLSGDLDLDDDVDFYDLAKLANNWLVDVGYEPPPDTTPPEPNPMQWASGGGPHEIQCPGGYCATMTAKTATDPSGGVQYYFECLDYPKLPPNGFSSGWQSSPSYTVLVSTYSGQDYRFRVKARDIHGNETAYSPALPMN
ncbi:MAG: hypothetical protein OEW48_06110 [Phycisphaerae bacterium]|nr:hypothetical protein [Phycisphaerae bacterium]